MFSRLMTATVLSGALLLTACTGDDSDSGDAAQRLDAASEALTEAESFDISLSTKELPSGTRGLLSAEGVGDHSPAFEGDVKVVAGGATLAAEVISVDGTTYAKTGFSPVWAPLDPATLGAPDPAALVGTDADSGLGALLKATTEPEVEDKSRDGDLVLTEISGELPGDRIAQLIPTADATEDFDVVYRLTDDDELHDAKISGPFYGGEDVTYTLRLSPRDEPAGIEAP
ncbi:LppX_LprAFG lipoprotein [Aeromicrobium sp. Marseille-Q0843]|uniref:LppX_LprAFG lipoprotein n=1 Tax=Aeromicrobium phoceense TaxID=2754045 RepID=A0A838XFL5_9ACTN|nr:LppX_LprAFG lipoprotein [Aeromicrobium phoceense]